MRAFAMIVMLTAMTALPVEAQPGGPGGFERAKKQKQGGKPDLSVEGFKSAMSMGQARLAVLQKQLDAKEGQAPEKRFALLTEMAFQAGDLATLCQDAAWSPAVQSELERAMDTGNDERTAQLEGVVKEFEACVSAGRDLAIVALSQAVKLAPDREGVDELVFQLGYFQLQAGKGAQGAQTMRYLLDSYPQSDYVPEAWLMVGERLFENAAFDKALAAYSKVDSFQGSRMRPYAKYKSAWTLYNLGRFDEAYRALVTTADMTGAGSAWHALYKEVLRDLARFYSEVGKPEEALETFKKLDEGFHMSMASALANMYFDKGEFEKSIAVLDALLAASPDNDNALAWLALRLDNTVARGDSAGVPSATRALAEHFKKLRKTRPGLAKKHESAVRDLLQSTVNLFPGLKSVFDDLFAE